MSPFVESGGRRENFGKILSDGLNCSPRWEILGAAAHAKSMLIGGTFDAHTIGVLNIPICAFIRVPEFPANESPTRQGVSRWR